MEKLTNSRIMARQMCPTKEFLQYSERLRPIGVQWALSIGTAWHVGLEAWGKGAGEDAAVQAGLETLDWIESTDVETMYKLELERARTEVLIRQAVRRFLPRTMVAVELEFEIPILNPATGKKSRSFTLAGKADGVCEIDGELWLLENKSTGLSLEQYRGGYGLSNQLSLYLYAVSRALGKPLAGAVMRTIVKTRVEPRRKGGEIIEDWDSYRERLMENYDTEPERFLAEDRVYRSPEELQRFESELWTETLERNWQKRSGTIRRNTGHCSEFGGCPYKAICLGVEGARDSLFRVSTTTHDELSSPETA
ncbi:MAG: PD-(D/E)XK nuclease family protein [Bacilli bacterium]